MTKKITPAEQYEQWLAENRPELRAAEEPRSDDHVCESGHTWLVAPDKVKGGRTCPSCTKKNVFLGNDVTPELGISISRKTTGASRLWNRT